MKNNSIEFRPIDLILGTAMAFLTIILVVALLVHTVYTEEAAHNDIYQKMEVLEKKMETINKIYYK